MANKPGKPASLQLSDLPLQWRWKGTIGHPREAVDKVLEAMEGLGYQCQPHDTAMRAEPLSGIAEFDWQLRFRKDQRAGFAHRGALIASGVLMLVGLATAIAVMVAVAEAGLLVLLGLVPAVIVLAVGAILAWKASSHVHRRLLVLEWRGEAYEAGERVGQGARDNSRRQVSANVRVAARALHGRGDGPWDVSRHMEGADPQLDSDVDAINRLVVSWDEQGARTYARIG